MLVKDDGLQDLLNDENIFCKIVIGFFGLIVGFIY